MSVAERLLVLFGACGGVAIAVFLAIAFSTRFSRQEQAYVQKRAYAIRARWFAGLLITVLILWAASLPFFPYLSANAALAPALRVPVIAEQYAFVMRSHLPVNRPIIFEVTSRDVNHDFGLYDASNRLIAQVQAMPDYTNYLRVVFHKPGQYTVRCLEYCGVGHALMEKTLTVGGK